MRIDPTNTQKEHTYQVVLDALALTNCYPAFLITTDVPKIYMQQFWFTINKKDSTTYRFKIDKKRYRFGLDKMRLSRAQILWGMYYKKNVDFVELLWEDFVFQIDNRDIKKQKKKLFMHTARDDCVLSTMRFVSKFEDFQVYRALLPEVMTNQKKRNSPAYKTYLTYATGTATPKKARKFKKSASPSKKRTLVIVDEEEPEPTKKVSASKKKTPTITDRSKGIDLLSDVVVLEAAQLKKVLKRSKQDTSIHQAGGSGDGTGSKPGVPDEPKGKSVDTNEGTGLKLGVPDMSKSDSSETGNDDLEQADYERTNSENQKSTKEDEESDDTFIHTPEDYVPTDDETNNEAKGVDEEDYERIQRELYDDVNVRLTFAEQDDEGKEDAEITDATQIATTELPLVSSNRSISSTFTNAMLNLENLNAGKTEAILLLDIVVQHEAPCTSPLLTIPVYVIFEQPAINLFDTVTTAPAPTISLLLSSLYPALQQITPIPTPTTTEATTTVTIVLESETLAALQLRVTNFEKENSLEPIWMMLFISTKKSTEEIWKIKLEHASKQQRPKDTITSVDTDELEEFDQKTALFEIMSKTKSFNKNPKHIALYHALMQSIIEDKNDMDKGVADQLKKRKPNDAEKDEGTSKSQPKSTRKSAQAEETVFKARDTQGSQNLREDTGNTDEPPVVNVDPKDWFKKSKRPLTLDPEWNEGKSVENKPTQKWLSDLAKAEKPSKTFDDLMSTLIDFSAFFMNRLQISDLTQDILVGPAYNILKGTCRSTSHWGPKRQRFYGYAFHRVSKHDVYSTKRILTVTNVKVKEWYGYGHLKEIEV
ncbi:hypothetical protein Tco_0424162 [Tanacetum coccineum]